MRAWLTEQQHAQEQLQPLQALADGGRARLAHLAATDARLASSTQAIATAVGTLGAMRERTAGAVDRMQAAMTGGGTGGAAAAAVDAERQLEQGDASEAAVEAWGVEAWAAVGGAVAAAMAVPVAHAMVWPRRARARAATPHRPAPDSVWTRLPVRGSCWCGSYVCVLIFFVHMIVCVRCLYVFVWARHLKLVFNGSPFLKI